MRVNADQHPDALIPLKDRGEIREPGDPFPIAGHAHDEPERSERWLTCERCREPGPDVKFYPDHNGDPFEDSMILLCSRCR